MAALSENIKWDVMVPDPVHRERLRRNYQELERDVWKYHRWFVEARDRAYDLETRIKEGDNE